MPRKPNLLFILTDQQRHDTLACYGNDRVQATNLNALARESFVFERAYTAQPVCTPARSTIMTGLYPHATGCPSNDLPLPPEVPTLPEMLPDDYVRGHFGKWHLGDEFHTKRGFHKWVSMDDYPGYYESDPPPTRSSDYHYFLLEQGLEPDVEIAGTRVFGRTGAANLPEHLTKAAFLGREASSFIRENRGEPFIAYVSFHEPHSPYTGPFNELHSPDELPTGPHFLQKPPANASLLNRMFADYYAQHSFKGFDSNTEAGARKLRAQYMGLVTLVDHAVGEILRTLDDCGLAENTIVVFTSDHGEMLGDHFLVTKGVMYEGAIRIPLLMRVPGLGRAQRVLPGCFGQVDLVPTLLELMGAEAPVDLHGRSRAYVIRGEATLEENDVIVEWNGSDGRDRPVPPFSDADEKTKRILAGPWRTILARDGWKLNLSPEDQCELYDLNSDPCELENGLDDVSQKDRIRELTDRVREWQTCVDDRAPLPAV